MSGRNIFVGEYFISERHRQMFSSVLSGRNIQILLKLSVETGKAPVPHLPRNQI